MRAVALSILAGVLACSSSIAAEASRDSDSHYLTGEYRLDGYWLLSGKWMGEMGLALKIEKNRFKYWFSSDAKFDHEPTYPLLGEVEIAKNVVHLKRAGQEHLYAKKWHLVIYKNQICLLADNHYQDYLKTDKLDDSRLLFKVRDEDIPDKNKPQLNAPVRIDNWRIMGVQAVPESKQAPGK
jgi:hypothetical protein